MEFDFSNLLKDLPKFGLVVLPLNSIFFGYFLIVNYNFNNQAKSIKKLMNIYM